VSDGAVAIFVVKQTGCRALRRGRLRDEFRRQIEIEFIGAHRSFLARDAARRPQFWEMMLRENIIRHKRNALPHVRKNPLKLI
jgi:hypothetical protein